LKRKELMKREKKNYDLSGTSEGTRLGIKLEFRGNQRKGSPSECEIDSR